MKLPCYFQLLQPKKLYSVHTSSLVQMQQQSSNKGKGETVHTLKFSGFNISNDTNWKVFGTIEDLAGLSS